MVSKVIFGDIVLYAEKRYNPETKKSVIVLMDEEELLRQQSEIREYVRRISK